MRFIAYTTKGLEELAKDELVRKIDAKIITSATKRIIFDAKADFKVLIALSTIDDVGILLAQVDNLKNIEQISEAVDNLDFHAVVKEIQKYRKIDDSFSLTISSASSSIPSKEILKIVSNNIEKRYNWHFTEFDHSNFDMRLFIDKAAFIISVRITQESLHHRSYKISSKPGSLKPTIAAAMVQLATNCKTGLKIVDDFCGSGTILCESVLSGHNVYGGDIDTESVQITVNNLNELHHKSEDKIRVLDATKTSWQSGFFDCAISNLPWDKQIEISSITNLYDEAIREYARILKPSSSLCVLISKPDLFIKYAKKYFPAKSIKQTKIGLLGQNPSIILVQ